MRKTIIASLTALCLAAAPAYADHDRYHDGHRNRHDNGSPWVGLAIVGAIAGLAMIASSDRDRPRPQAPVYVEPTSSPPYSAPYSAPYSPPYSPPPPPTAAMPPPPAPLITAGRATCTTRTRAPAQKAGRRYRPARTDIFATPPPPPRQCPWTTH